MTTAPPQPEGAIWQYGFGVPADMLHGAHGTASNPSRTMNVLSDPMHGSMADIYGESAYEMLARQNMGHVAFQAYWQEPENLERDSHKTINMVNAAKLGVVGYPMMTIGLPEASPRSFPDKSDFVISRALQYDALRFVSWLEGWDGEDGERIHCDVAFRALEIVSRLRSEFDEPFFAPAPSGAILLQWKISDGTVVDVFVESAETFPECAVLTKDDSVDDVELSSLSDLRSLLRNLESASASH
ncbi:MAG: hypothetical protein OXD50_13615 [Chloroflexi bacterium]|nr:hypothetical protein [Chloroflexota bacterium]